MNEIVIIGAGGFGREVKWLIERINSTQEKLMWNLLGFIDDNLNLGDIVDGLPVIGNIEYLKKLDKEINVVCAVGNSKIRKSIIGNLKHNKNLNFPNIIDPSLISSNLVTMGQGNIICAGNIITVNVGIGDFCIVNLNCTIGHDAVIEDYVTVFPNVNISGNVTVGEQSEIGTGSKIIQGLKINPNCIIGAGSVIVRDLICRGTYVGVPAKLIK